MDKTHKIISIIAGILSIIVSYFAIKSWYDNRQAQIHLVLYANKQMINVDDKNYFFTLFPTVGQSLEFGYGKDGNYNMPMPFVFNNSNRSLKDFKLEVTISHINFEFEKKDINTDFDILKTNDHESKLRYKYNVFYANSRISVPINRFNITDDYYNNYVYKTYLKDSHSTLFLTYDYSISYNENPKPVKYKVFLVVTSFSRIKFFKECIDDFLKEYYSVESLKGDSTLASIVGGPELTFLLKPAKTISSVNEVEEIKTEIIEEMGKYYDIN